MLPVSLFCEDATFVAETKEVRFGENLVGRPHPVGVCKRDESLSLAEPSLHLQVFARC